MRPVSPHPQRSEQRARDGIHGDGARCEQRAARGDHLHQVRGGVRHPRDVRRRLLQQREDRVVLLLPDPMPHQSGDGRDDGPRQPVQRAPSLPEQRADGDGEGELLPRDVARGPDAQDGRRQQGVWTLRQRRRDADLGRVVSRPSDAKRGAHQRALGHRGGLRGAGERPRDEQVHAAADGGVYEPLRRGGFSLLRQKCWQVARGGECPIRAEDEARGAEGLERAE